MSFDFLIKKYRFFVISLILIQFFFHIKSSIFAKDDNTIWINHLLFNSEDFYAIKNNFINNSTIFLPKNNHVKSDTVKFYATLLEQRKFDEILHISDRNHESYLLVLYFQALAYLGKGDLENSKKIINFFLNSGLYISNISKNQLLLTLSKLLRGTKNYNHAISILQKMIFYNDESRTFNTEVKLELARNFIENRDYHSAIKLFQTELLQELNHDSGSNSEIVYCYGKLFFHMGDFQKASKIFFLIPKKIPIYGFIAYLDGIASLSKFDNKDAIKRLEEFIDEANVDQETKTAFYNQQKFRLLKQLFEIEGKYDIPKLLSWSSDTKDTQRAQWAYWLQFMSNIHQENILYQITKIVPYNDLSACAQLFLAMIKYENGFIEESLKLVTNIEYSTIKIKASIFYMQGLANTALKRWNNAFDCFEESKNLDRELFYSSLVNEVLLISWRDRGNLENSESAKLLISSSYPEVSEEMYFQIACDKLRNNNLSGISILNHLILSSRNIDLTHRARMCINEINCIKRNQLVLNNFKMLQSYRLSPEREDYFKLFIVYNNLSNNCISFFINKSNEFLKQYPYSYFDLSVQLNLASAYFFAEQFSLSAELFQKIAVSNQNEKMDKILFFALESELFQNKQNNLENLFLLLEKIIIQHPTDRLAWEARLLQGLIKHAQNLPLVAITVYDYVISTNHPFNDIRAAAFMAKGDILHQLGNIDIYEEEKAIQTWLILANMCDMPLEWREEAWCKSGIVSEMLGKDKESLSYYNKIFSCSTHNNCNQIFWYEKAGFHLAHLLEKDEQWHEAILTYQRLIDLKSPRSSEAKIRLENMKLNHMIWTN